MYGEFSFWCSVQATSDAFGAVQQGLWSNSDWSCRKQQFKFFLFFSPLNCHRFMILMRDKCTIFMYTEILSKRLDLSFLNIYKNKAHLKKRKRENVDSKNTVPFIPKINLKNMVHKIYFISLLMIFLFLLHSKKVKVCTIRNIITFKSIK